MARFKFFMLLLSAAMLLGSCKEEEDPCVENVVGGWHGDFDDSGPGGGTSSSISISIQPESGCGIIITNLPYEYDPSSFQVRAIVSAGNITINSQPFGAGTITGQGSVYLNQLTLSTTVSNGWTYQIACSK